ncbi:hypothetical protein FRC10_004633 [Ceratobasidium sp. 414]|nr:hypothetical protein FRC10_004633 [Ceratobasidium sp. 414]
MLRTSFITGALLLSSYANAFYDTVPIAVWTSTQSSSAIRSLKDHVPQVPSQAQVLNALMSNDELCSLDAIVVVGQPGLHAGQLASLTSDSHLKSRLQAAVSKVHFPYVPVSSVADADSIARDVAALCQSVSTEWSAGRVLERSNKYVLHFELPEAKDKFWSTHDQVLEENLAEISSTFNSYAVFLTGTGQADSTLVTKRQQPNHLSSPGFANPIILLANITEPTGGILARYQLLTPGLLTGLLIAFGLLIPLLMVGVNALASIQNPIRTEAPKGLSLEKKNQ